LIVFPKEKSGVKNQGSGLEISLPNTDAALQYNIYDQQGFGLIGAEATSSSAIWH
jgi:hypothetical protein